MPLRKSLAALAMMVCATGAVAQDVYVPPVPIGIARDGKARVPKRPIPFPSADERWVRVRTPHFDIISSASEERTRAIASDLETLASALLQTSARFEVSRTPPTIVVFGRRRESQPYFDLLIGQEGTAVTGVYVRHDGGGTMFVDGGRGQFERTAMHELVHDLLRQSEAVPPLWIEEGVAEYFSNAQVKKDAVLAGAPIREHLALLRRSEIDVPAMFAVRAESAEATAPLFYAQSWAAVDWLMRLDSARFYPFLRDLENGATPADALRTHYGKTLADLEQALRKPKSGKQQHVGRASARPEAVPQDLPGPPSSSNLARFFRTSAAPARSRCATIARRCRSIRTTPARSPPSASSSAPSPLTLQMPTCISPTPRRSSDARSATSRACSKPPPTTRLGSARRVLSQRKRSPSAATRRSRAA